MVLSRLLRFVVGGIVGVYYLERIGVVSDMEMGILDAFQHILTFIVVACIHVLLFSSIHVLINTITDIYTCLPLSQNIIQVHPHPVLS